MFCMQDKNRTFQILSRSYCAYLKLDIPRTVVKNADQHTTLSLSSNFIVYNRNHCSLINRNLSKAVLANYPSASWTFSACAENRNLKIPDSTDSNRKVGEELDILVNRNDPISGRVPNRIFIIENERFKYDRGFFPGVQAPWGDTPASPRLCVRRAVQKCNVLFLVLKADRKVHSGIIVAGWTKAHSGTCSLWDRVLHGEEVCFDCCCFFTWLFNFHWS